MNSLAYTSIFALNLYAFNCTPDEKVLRIRGAPTELRSLPIIREQQNTQIESRTESPLQPKNEGKPYPAEKRK